MRVEPLLNGISALRRRAKEIEVYSFSIMKIQQDIWPENQEKGSLSGTKLADQIQIDLDFPSSTTARKISVVWLSSPHGTRTSFVEDNFSMHWWGDAISG